MKPTTAGLLCLLGACTSYGTVDGDIHYDHRLNPDAPQTETLLIQPDGMMHRTRGGYTSGDDTLILSADVLDTVYGQATDAHFADLPADIKCGCTDDYLTIYTVMVTVDGTPYQTSTHQLKATPGGLAKLLGTLNGLATQ